MIRLVASTAMAAVVVLTASCAPGAGAGASGDSASARSGHQCFRPEQVHNFRQGGPGQVYVRATRNDVYELNSSGGCTDLDFAHRLAITADGPALAGGRLCTGDWARIRLPDSPPALNTCRARVERVLMAEEVAALPDAHRP